MPVTDILISAVPGEVRAALYEDGQLVEFHVERDSARNQVGAIHFGRVVAVPAGLQAAFVDIGSGPPGFLPLAEGEKRTEGEGVLVQVRRPATAEHGETKGPRLSAKPELAGRYAVLLPAETGVAVSRKIASAETRERLRDLVAGLAGPGGVQVRTAAENVNADELTGEITGLRRRWAEISTRAAAAKSPACLAEADGLINRLLALPVARVRINDPVLARQVSDPRIEPLDADDWRVAASDLWAAMEPKVDLPSGGNLIIEETAALTAVDVNAGPGRRGASEQSNLAVNLEAAATLARHMRLRNLVGQILVDFLPLRNRENRRKVERVLLDGRDNLAKVIGWTRLGLLELTRRRVRPPLSAVLFGPCPACEGVGRRVSVQTAAFDVFRWLLVHRPVKPVRVAPDIFEMIKGDLAGHWNEMVKRVGGEVALSPDKELTAGTFDPGEMEKPR